MRKNNATTARKIITAIILDDNIAFGSEAVNRVVKWRDTPYWGSLNLEYNPHDLWAVGVSLNVSVDFTNSVPDGVSVSSGGTSRSVASTQILIEHLTKVGATAAKIQAYLEGVEVVPDEVA